MRPSAIWVRSGGVIVLLVGIALVMLSGELFPSFLSVQEKGQELMARAGFAMALIGLFSVFLHSEKLLPSDYVTSLARTGNGNILRIVEGMNLSGHGIYLPPGGRLLEDRVFVPADDRDLPVPDPSDGTVFNTGDLGPGLGAFFIPPGKDLLDRIEQMAGKDPSKVPMESAEEYLGLLTKGTGLIKRIEQKDKGDRIDLTIVHSRLLSTCDDVWEKDPKFHGQVGCTGCSMVLTAVSRMVGSPLSIISASKEDGKVRYVLRRV